MTFDWTGWEAETDLGNDDDRDGVFYLTIRRDEEEYAIIVHRTCDGKFPLDGEAAKSKELRAAEMVAMLNAAAPENAAVTYSPHYFHGAEGHLYFDVPPDGPCTIVLKPAASADQAWLDEKGQRIARLLNGEA